MTERLLTHANAVNRPVQRSPPVILLDVEIHGLKIGIRARLLIVGVRDGDIAHARGGPETRGAWVDR